jgi:hypothetical protein
MTAWSGFYDSVLPELNGITTAVVDHTLRQVAIDFCERTCIHSEEVTPINVVAGTANYVLSPLTTGTEAYKIKAAWYDGVPLDIAPLDALNSAYQYWRDHDSPDPRAYTQAKPGEIILYPKPSEDLTGGLRVEIILRPTQTATLLTTWIAERYMYDLSCGVKGRLMAQPGRPWTNPEMASYYLNHYNTARAKATIEANTSLTRGALSVRPRPAA